MPDPGHLDSQEQEFGPPDICSLSYQAGKCKACENEAEIAKMFEYKYSSRMP